MFDYIFFRLLHVLMSSTYYRLDVCAFVNFSVCKTKQEFSVINN